MDSPLTPETVAAINEKLAEPVANLGTLRRLARDLEENGDPDAADVARAVDELRASRELSAVDPVEQFPSSSAAKTDLPHLRRITVELEQISDGHGPDHETPGASTFSWELLGNIAETTRAAAVELAHYRTLFTPGYVGEEGLRFTDLRDASADYNPRNPQGLG